MTVSTVTAFSGITDKAPISPAYMNSKFTEVYDNLNALNSFSTDFGAVTSGSTTTFPVAQRFVLASVDSGGFGINLLAYGADPTGTTDCSAAIVSACSAANTSKSNYPILVPPGFYRIDSTVTLWTSMLGHTFLGAGPYASVFTSTQSSDMFRTNCDTGLRFENIGFQLSGSSWTNAIAVHLMANTNEFTMRGCEIFSIGSFGILYEVDTGSGGLIADTIFYTSSATTLSSGQSNVAAIGQRGLDTAARPRLVNNCHGIGGTDLWNLDAANDFFATGGSFRNAVVTGESGTPVNIVYNGVRFATLGYPTYLRGNTPVMMPANHAGNIIIDTGVQSAVVVTSTVSGITDNSSSTHMIYGGAYNQGLGIGLTASYLSVGNLTAGGTAVRGISSLSTKIAAVVVQGSASSFTLVAWPAVQPGDQIMVTIQPDATASSLSSGLVLHSHCTKAGQAELRWSNVSTLQQDQSSKTYYLTRLTPF